MTQAFAALFNMLAAFFRAGAKLGNATENMAGWAEEASGVFVDEARSDREIKLLESQQRREMLLASIQAKATPAKAVKALKNEV